MRRRDGEIELSVVLLLQDNRDVEGSLRCNDVVDDCQRLPVIGEFPCFRLADLHSLGFTFAFNYEVIAIPVRTARNFLPTDRVLALPAVRRVRKRCKDVPLLARLRSGDVEAGIPVADLAGQLLRCG